MILEWHHWLEFALLLASLGAGCYTLYLCFLDCRDATLAWLAGYNAERAIHAKGEDYVERDRRAQAA